MLSQLWCVAGYAQAAVCAACVDGVRSRPSRGFLSSTDAPAPTPRRRLW
jgi:hypothetical protein